MKSVIVAASVCWIITAAAEYSIREIEPQFIFEQSGKMAMGPAHGHLVTEFHADVLLAQESKVENFFKNATKFFGSLDDESRHQFNLRASMLFTDFIRVKNRLRVLIVTFGLKPKKKRVERGIFGGLSFFGTFANLAWNGYQEKEIHDVVHLAKDNKKSIDVLAMFVHKVDQACALNSNNIKQIEKVMHKIGDDVMALDKILAVESFMSEFESHVHEWILQTEFFVADALALLDGALRP